VLAVFCLLQAIPLPFAWLQKIAPANADIWARALMPLGEAGPGFASISLDPGASVVEGLKWASYAALFTAAATVSARYGATVGVAVVFLSATCVAFATMAHGLLGMKDVYGIYKPSVDLPPWHVGPLINGNTLAGYLNLGVLSGMALVLTRSRDMPRWLIAVGIAFLIGVSVTSASRGGLITLLVGVLLLAALLQAKSSRRDEEDSVESKASARWLLVGTLVAGGLLAALGGNRDTWLELYDKNLSKLEMVLWAKPLLQNHFGTGIGRGAFESVFPAHRTVPGHVVYAYLENFPGQWLVEWGVPLGTLGLVAFGWTLRPTKLGARHSGLAAAAFTGVIVLLLQNLADLSLEIPAVCYALVVTIGSLWGDNLRSRVGVEYAQNRSLRVGKLAPHFVFVSGLVLALFAFKFGHPNVGSERDQIKKAYESRDVSDPAVRAELRTALRRAMLRHPGEPYFPLVGALIATRTKSESAIPWLQRSLERSPVNPRAHLLLAEVLGTHGAPKQAMLELRFAAEQDIQLIDIAARLAIRFSKKYEELMLAVPEGYRGAEVLDWLARFAQEAKQPSLRTRFDVEAIARNPSIFGPRVREVEMRLTALADKNPQQAGCKDRDTCVQEIEEHIAALGKSHPLDSTSIRFSARLLVIEGKPEKADALLTDRCVHVTDRGECMRARVEAAAKITDPSRIDIAIREFLGASCLTSTDCAEACAYAAGVRERRGEGASAVMLYARAAREDGTEARWMALATAASRSGAHAQAVDALERIATKRGGVDEDIRKRILEERAKALGKFGP
jgi:hypothetical protein